MNSENFNKIIEFIEAGAVVITANRRLSAIISEGYDRWRISAGHTLWETPVVMPLGAWVIERWSAASGAPVLTAAREGALWERIVSGDKALMGKKVLHTRGVAESASRAWRLMREYRAPVPEDIYLTEEAGALKRWAATYERELERLSFTDMAGATSGLAKHFSAGTLKAPSLVVLAGFDEITPLQKTLVEALEARGTRVGYWPDEPSGEAAALKLPEPAPRVTVRCYADETEEVVAAARWVRKTLEPDTTIGVVVPELSRYRETIIREFASELNPASVLPGAAPKDVFNISLGSPLSGEPIVRAALELLALDFAPVELKRMTALLFSPFVTPPGADRSAAAAFDMKMRGLGRTLVHLGQVAQALKREGASAAFSSRIEKWTDALGQDLYKRQRPSQWAADLTRTLGAVGFAKDVELTSSEFQALKAWGELVEEFASLDDILGPIRRTDAVREINRLAGAKIHQRETGKCCVQVLGLLEAAGTSFDRVVVLGCHEYALPARTGPNPFIPVYIQKKHGMPHSTLSRELDYSKRLLSRLFKSAPEFVVSYPATVDDMETHLSPLLSFLLPDGAATAEVSRPEAETSRLKDAQLAAASVEKMPAYAPVQCSHEELESVRGGTNIIKDQSACPFRAFAIHRLGAAKLPEPEPGITALTRGSVVHDALNNFWSEVKSSVRLKELDEAGKLAEVIEKAAWSASKKIRVEAPLGEKFLALERERLAALLTEWVNTENNRPGFTVAALEEPVEITLGRLKITGRMDRVDVLEDGTRALVDYKTGRCKVGDWLSSRPKDPQLPLYAGADNFSAVAFARVRPGECSYAGLCEADVNIAGVKTTEEQKLVSPDGTVIEWAGLMRMWRTSVETLAEAFVAGQARVDPNPELKGTDFPCTHCELAALCRIFETSRNIDEGTDDE